MAKEIEVQQISSIEDPQRMSVVSDNQKLVDTLHGDEALKVIAASGGDDYWDDHEEKKLVRKIDRRLMPILCITYGVQYYDKAMLAQAVSHSLSSLSDTSYSQGMLANCCHFSRLCSVSEKTWTLKPETASSFPLPSSTLALLLAPIQPS